jgi:aromatic ring-cleaving dioxygenase
MTGLPELHGYHVHIYYDEATLQGNRLNVRRSVG